jgi:hypothetical protein
VGTSSSVAELVGKLGQAARELEDAPREGVREAAIVGKAIMESALPTKKLTNYGRNGRKMGARFTAPKGDPPYSVLDYYGPVQLVNTGARPHLIGPKGGQLGTSQLGGNRWRAGRKAGKLKFTGGDGGIRSGIVYHPGTKGSAREFFPNAKRKVVAAAPKQIEMATGRALRKVF